MSMHECTSIIGGMQGQKFKRVIFFGKTKQSLANSDKKPLIFFRDFLGVWGIKRLSGIPFSEHTLTTSAYHPLSKPKVLTENWKD